MNKKVKLFDKDKKKLKKNNSIFTKDIKTLYSTHKTFSGKNTILLPLKNNSKRRINTLENKNFTQIVKSDQGKKLLTKKLRNSQNLKKKLIPRFKINEESKLILRQKIHEIIDEKSNLKFPNIKDDFLQIWVLC